MRDKICEPFFLFRAFVCPAFVLVAASFKTSIGESYTINWPSIRASCRSNRLGCRMVQLRLEHQVEKDIEVSRIAESRCIEELSGEEYYSDLRRIAEY